MAIKSYKGFDKNLRCRDFQYKIGGIYEMDGEIKVCSRGFHACESPFDVFDYYTMIDSRFCEVEQDGNISKEDRRTKICSSKIKIKTELKLADMINLGIEWLKEITLPEKIKTSIKDNSSGNYAQIGSSGDGAKIGSSGNNAQIGSSGNNAKIGSSGDGAKIGSSGYDAKIGSSGYDAKIGSSGNNAKIGSSGDGAKIARPLMSLFVKDEEVIGHGVVYLHLIAVMYILPAVTNALQGFFRGIGDLKVTLMSSFTNMTVRVIAAAPMVLLWNFGIEALPYSYLAGWIAMLLVETPLMLRIYRKK